MTNRCYSSITNYWYTLFCLYCDLTKSIGNVRNQSYKYFMLNMGQPQCVVENYEGPLLKKLKTKAWEKKKLSNLFYDTVLCEIDYLSHDWTLSPGLELHKRIINGLWMRFPVGVDEVCIAKLYSMFVEFIMIGIRDIFENVPFPILFWQKFCFEHFILLYK